MKGVQVLKQNVCLFIVIIIIIIIIIIISIIIIIRIIKSSLAFYPLYSHCYWLV